MSQKVKDLRLRRTQKLLREALIALIEERGFDALTIGEITERAMVSRAAFYRWFVRKMRAALAGLITERGQMPHGPNTAGQPVHTFSDAFVPDLVSALFVEAITWWLEQGKPYTSREIARRTALLAAALFKEAGSWHTII